MRPPGPEPVSEFRPVRNNTPPGNERVGMLVEIPRTPTAPKGQKWLRSVIGTALLGRDWQRLAEVPKEEFEAALADRDCRAVHICVVVERQRERRAFG